jgi:molecular chaperone DnaK (HSP70)
MVVFRDGSCTTRDHQPQHPHPLPSAPATTTSTSHDGQTTIDLWLVQGESDDPLECNVLGHFEFYGIPRAGPPPSLAWP